MPEIRSITYFTNLTPDLSALSAADAFLSAARASFETAGIAVQSNRVATQPFAGGLASAPADLPTIAQDIDAACADLAIHYISIGPTSVQDDAAYLKALREVFATTERVFATASLTQDGAIDLPYVTNVARLVDQISRIRPDGMSNLFFAALANCPPHSPFFPVAYHDGGQPAFGLAIQAADLANSAFAAAKTPQEARQNLITSIEAYAAQLLPVAQAVAAEQGIAFKGFDLSLAPYPTDEKSLGGALEKLGPSFGGHGLVASASLIMNAIEAADFPSTGFSGLMLPILEDSVLAARTAQGRLSMNDLLLLSAICGTGLDCIPLAGDIGAEGLYPILLDTAALALRLDKPLTARLMPFPNKKAGDALTFDFEYFANSQVLPTPDYIVKPADALGSAAGQLAVKPRPR